MNILEDVGPEAPFLMVEVLEEWRKDLEEVHTEVKDSLLKVWGTLCQQQTITLRGLII